MTVPFKKLVEGTAHLPHFYLQKEKNRDLCTSNRDSRPVLNKLLSNDLIILNLSKYENINTLDLIFNNLINDYFLFQKVQFA